MFPAQTDGPDLPVCVISFRSLPARVLIWSSALNRPLAMASISRMSTVWSGAWPIQFQPTRSTTSSTGSWGSPVCVRFAGSPE
eukprot:scaffold40802_cov72-Phaeocystis_antarctica.AAC.2